MGPVVYAGADDVIVQRYSAGAIGDVRIVRGRHEKAWLSSPTCKYSSVADGPLKLIG